MPLEGSAVDCECWRRVSGKEASPFPLRQRGRTYSDQESARRLTSTLAAAMQSSKETVSAARGGASQKERFQVERSEDWANARHTEQAIAKCSGEEAKSLYFSFGLSSSTSHD